MCCSEGFTLWTGHRPAGYTRPCSILWTSCHLQGGTYVAVHVQQWHSSELGDRCKRLDSQHGAERDVCLLFTPRHRRRWQRMSLRRNWGISWRTSATRLSGRQLAVLCCCQDAFGREFVPVVFCMRHRGRRSEFTDISLMFTLRETRQRPVQICGLRLC